MDGKSTEVRWGNPADARIAAEHRSSGYVVEGHIRLAEGLHLGQRSESHHRYEHGTGSIRW